MSSIDNTTWFWEIVDENGLADVPSDVKPALRLIVRRLAKVQRERDAARRSLAFFASVIKSGEPWTETCEREYRAALSCQGPSK